MDYKIIYNKKNTDDTIRVSGHAVNGQTEPGGFDPEGNTVYLAGLPVNPCLYGID